MDQTVNEREAVPRHITVVRFGSQSEEVDILPEDVLFFPKGISGFEEKTRYILIADVDFPPFFWLQCIDDPAVGFAIIDPRLLVPDYTVDVSDEWVGLLELRDPSEASVWAVVTLATDLAQITANLLAPIIINTDARLGAQIIQNESTYSLRHPLVTAQPASEAEELQPVGSSFPPAGQQC